MTGKSFEEKRTGYKNNADELQLLRSAVDYAPVAISITRKNGHHLYHNPKFTTLFGYDISELGKASFRDLFVDAAMFEHILDSLENSGFWTGEVRMKKKSGNTMMIDLKAEAVTSDAGTTDTGKAVTFIGTYVDITEKKAKEKKIRYQHEYLSTLHSISIGMFRQLNLSELLNAIITRASRITGIPNGFLELYDPEENVLILEAACGNLTDSIGYKVKPGQGLGGTIFSSGEPAIIQNYQEWAHGIKEVVFEKIYCVVGIPLMSGTTIEGVIGLSHHEPEYAIDPEIVTILEEFSGIAQIAIHNARLFEKQKLEFERRIALEKERKDMEIKLQQSQRMESIGTLAGGIAHDFNNILSSIMGYAQIARIEADEGSSLASDLDEIYNSSLRARDLTRQILTFARQTDEKVNPLNIDLVAKEVLKFIRSSIPSTIQIRHNISCSSQVLADPTQVYQIFLNLMTNAAQAMEKDGGELSLDLTDEIITEPLETIEPGEYVKIKISDTGTGIPKENLPSIFDPYFTTKEVGEGTGLGLAVVHGAVKRVGGDIFVDSQEGLGTCFTIYLPICKEPIDENLIDSDREYLPEGNGEHVIVVDDEIPIIRVEKRLLERLNYKVTTFNNSFEALEYFNSNAEDISLVLTDMTMPGMTGEQLIQAVRKTRPEIPVILCTGFCQHLTKKSLEKKNIKYCCRKPFVSADLAKTVRDALYGTNGGTN